MKSVGNGTKNNSSLSLVLLSDSHDLHREIVEVPDGDLLIFAGDITFFSKNKSAIQDFNAWLGELPHLHKLVVYGNHDSFGEDAVAGRGLLSNATVLINEGIEIQGLTIWGSPVMPLSSGAFATPVAAERARIFASIPKGTDVLITHSPPLEILDHSADEAPAGCPELLMAVLQVKPKLHVFGHVHAGHGVMLIDDTTFVNASLLGRDGDLTHRPTVINMQWSR